MQARLLTRVAASIAMGVGMGAAAIAQSKGSGEWGQTVTTGATGAQELDAKQAAIVQKVTAYFNQMGDTKGEFTRQQTEELIRNHLSPRLFEEGLICRTDDRGDPVIQFAPPLIAGPEEFAEIDRVIRTVLPEAWARMGN